MTKNDKNQFKSSKEVSKAVESLEKSTKLNETIDKLSKNWPKFPKISKSMHELEAFQQRMAEISSKINGQDSKIKTLATLGEAASSAKALDTLSKLPNYEVESNLKLEAINRKFAELLEIGSAAANIANDLQGAAVELLTKFESAAENNKQSSKRMLIVACFALLAAVIMPSISIGYDLWKNEKSSRFLESRNAAYEETIQTQSELMSKMEQELEVLKSTIIKLNSVKSEKSLVSKKED